MAGYGVSQEGVSSLRQLAKDLSTINNDIDENGRTLKSKVSSLGEGLGIFEDKILELVANVNAAQEKGRDSVEQLANKVNKLASEVESLVNAGL